MNLAEAIDYPAIAVSSVSLRYTLRRRALQHRRALEEELAEYERLKESE